MKKFFCFLFAGTMLLCLAACKNQPKFNGSRTGNDSQLIMEYSAFNTTDSQKLDLQQGDTLAAAIVSNSGSLSVTIQKEGEEPIYQRESIPTGEFSIEIPEDGFYVISVVGENAAGSLSFVKEENG